MTLNTKDWKRLQQPILLLLAVFFLISICIYYAYDFCQAQSSIAQSQQLQLQAARAQLHASGTEKNDIALFLPQYETLITQGFIGEERRNAWVNALSDIQKTHQLFEIHYAIGQLETIPSPYLSNFSPFTLHKSSMKLNFDLLHEGDLLTLTNTLKTKRLAAWMLKSCEILNTNHDTPLANLHANCEIDWLTLVEPTQQMPSS